ncbi:hypothetical protein ACEPAI_7072 [Sanghuangporus weigelae]
MAISIDASQHLIKAVTVFSSRKAEVIRTFSVELAAGQNELSITSLPSCIDTESARVTGLGDAVLFDVVCTVDDARDVDDTKSATLNELERRRFTLESEKTLRNKAADILMQYGRSLSAEYSTTNGVESFLDSFVRRGSVVLKEVETLDEQIAQLGKEIAKEQRKIQKERQKAETLGRVSAVIMAKRAGKAEITLTYMVSHATWSPSYDLRATTEDGKPSGTVSLHYRASIQQNTGEDWRDTAVTVSTAKPGSWSTIPALRAMKISPAPREAATYRSKNTNAGSFGNKPPPPPPPARTMARATGGFVPRPAAPAAPPAPTVFGSFGQSSALTAVAAVSGVPRGTGEGWTTLGDEDYDSDEVADEERFGTWTETKAVVTESAVSSSFRIEGNCTIPSEPTAHKVAIAILSFAAKVHYITVPRSAPMSFLQCEVKNTSEYRLLPGSVNVFLDNSPVSRTTINDVSREEVFKCTLGPDPSLRVKCTRLPPVVSSSGSAYAAQTTVTTYKIATTVTNGHGFAVKGVQVRDCAPNVGQTSQNASGPGIKVVIKRPEGLGEASPEALVDIPKVSSSSTCSVKVRWKGDGGEKEGKYVWLVDLGAGEEVKLEAEYEVRAPADFTWQLLEDFCH